jgi:hypothetical protein
MSLKYLIKNFIVENDENLITLTPDEYTEVLDDVGGIAARVSNLKPYRGKGIVINGDLDLRNFKTVGPLTGIVRIMGRLDISYTNVPNLDGVTVDRYVSSWGSTMHTTQLKKERNKKLSELSDYRENDEWNIENNDDDSERTEALYEFLVQEGIPTLYEDDNGDEIEEDKYFIYPSGNATYGIGKQYEWLGGDTLQPDTYDVYTEDELEIAAKRYVENAVDDMGYDAFSEWVWDQAIDKGQWESWLEDFYEDIIRDDPENYDIGLELSTNQQHQVNQLKKTIENLNNKLKSEELSDEEYENIERKIEGLEETIEEIIEDPQGGYDESSIENEITDRVNEYVDDIDDFIKHYGYESSFIMDFVDLDEVTEIVVNSDGYGNLLNSYDGEMFETQVNGDWYFVMRAS